MPSGGHNKKPTALRVLEGNPGRRPLPVNEPKPAPIAPRCPAWLSKEAKKEWRRIAPLLMRLKLLTQVDMSTLAAYCHSYAQLIAAEAYLSKHGLGYAIPHLNEEGKLVGMRTGEWPQVRTARKCKEEIATFSAMFGLSPVDRSRLSVPGADAEDSGFASLLSGAKAYVRPGKSG